jgi:hypothetical protein
MTEFRCRRWNWGYTLTIALLAVLAAAAGLDWLWLGTLWDVAGTVPVGLACTWVLWLSTRDRLRAENWLRYLQAGGRQDSEQGRQLDPLR